MCACLNNSHCCTVNLASLLLCCCAAVLTERICMWTRRVLQCRKVEPIRYDASYADYATNSLPLPAHMQSPCLFMGQEHGITHPEQVCSAPPFAKHARRFLSGSGTSIVAIVQILEIHLCLVGTGSCCVYSLAT